VFSRCLPEGPPAPSLSYCDPPAVEAAVSLPASGSMAVVRTTKADHFFLNKALCIAQDNNPEVRVLGPFSLSDTYTPVSLFSHLSLWLSPRSWASTLRTRRGATRQTSTALCSATTFSSTATYAQPLSPHTRSGAGSKQAQALTNTLELKGFRHTLPTTPRSSALLHRQQRLSPPAMRH
jgi:hypothetical protein